MKIISGVFGGALALTGWISLGFVVAAAGAAALSWKCPPTPVDALGPFYKANAPVRASVGQGYELKGTVKSAKDCGAIGGARLEFWLAGPDGEYDDAHRATVVADQAGAYRFESNYPPRYSSRPAHIHLKVTAPGYRTLVTQHYPEAGRRQATFDPVLIPVD